MVFYGLTCVCLLLHNQGMMGLRWLIGTLAFSFTIMVIIQSRSFKVPFSEEEKAQHEGNVRRLRARLAKDRPSNR